MKEMLLRKTKKSGRKKLYLWTHDGIKFKTQAMQLSK